MNWIVILRLSLLGLAMALAGVFFVPANLEPLLWMAIYLYWAYAIASNTRFLRFFNGFVLGLLSSLWVTAVDDIFLARYLNRHPRAGAMVEMLHNANVSGSARHILRITGPATGIPIGFMIGMFAVIAGLMRKPRRLELPRDPQP